MIKAPILLNLWDPFKAKYSLPFLASYFCAMEVVWRFICSNLCPHLFAHFWLCSPCDLALSCSLIPFNIPHIILLIFLVCISSSSFSHLFSRHRFSYCNRTIFQCSDRPFLAFFVPATTVHHFFCIFPAFLSANESFLNYVETFSVLVLFHFTALLRTCTSNNSKIFWRFLFIAVSSLTFSYMFLASCPFREISTYLADYLEFRSYILISNCVIASAFYLLSSSRGLSVISSLKSVYNITSGAKLHENFARNAL